MSTGIDEYGKRALDFVEDMQKLTSYDDLCQRIVSELEWFGFTHVTILEMPGPGIDIHDCVSFNTRPDDWNEHYARENYIAKDPVVATLRSTVHPFTWDDVRKQPLTRAGRRIIDEGRDFDARNGIIVPIRSTSGSVALFSPCGRNPNVSPRAKSALDMIGLYSHHALQRAKIGSSRQNRPLARLTPREREVITWVALSKSDDEIGEILHLSSRTVTTHVENVKRKLNATRRTYAVLQALRFGEIAL